jgi:hypothetical protein
VGPHDAHKREPIQTGEAKEAAMKRHWRIHIVMGLCTTLVASSAWAESNAFVGRWHLNKAQSTLPPGEPVPNDFIHEISRADVSQLKWTTTLVAADGRSYVETFDATASGASHPVGDDTTVSFRLSGETLQATFKGPAGQSDVQTCTLSANQKQMSCKGVLTGANGQTVNYVDVYDRM